MLWNSKKMVHELLVNILTMFFWFLKLSIYIWCWCNDFEPLLIVIFLRLGLFIGLEDSLPWARLCGNTWRPMALTWLSSVRMEPSHAAESNGKILIKIQTWGNPQQDNFMFVGDQLQSLGVEEFQCLFVLIGGRKGVDCQVPERVFLWTDQGGNPTLTGGHGRL